MGALARFSDDLADLVATVVPCTVALSSGEGTGSGTVVDEHGHVVTACHVVEGGTHGSSVQAVVPGGHHRHAELVGIDHATDLAVLRLDRAPARHLSLRQVPARLGELCLAVGSPFGAYPESVSLGVVSGLARTIAQPHGRPIERAIQTDAAINPGNSGGPLVDAHGEVLGVTLAVDQRAQGIGFAIPADTVRTVLGTLLADGRVVRASLGVAVAVRQVVLDGHQPGEEGEHVARLAVVRSNGRVPGLEAGDVILAVDGHEVDERADLLAVLTADRIGRPTVIQLLRKGHRDAVTVIPVERQD